MMKRVPVIVIALLIGMGSQEASADVGKWFAKSLAVMGIGTKKAKMNAPTACQSQDAVKPLSMAAFEPDVNYTEKCKDHEPLSSEECWSLWLYTNGVYPSFNKPLRTQEWKTIPPVTQYAVETLSSALDKLPPFVGVTHRGIKVDEKDLKGFLSKYKEGGIINEPAFVSTSDANGRQDFVGFSSTNVRFIIQSKCGKKVRDYSIEKEENEVLFARGTDFKVHKVTEWEGNTWIYLEEAHSPLSNCSAEPT